MVLATPEFIVAEFVEMLDQCDIAAELQHRVLADRMVRGEKGAKTEPGHQVLLQVSRHPGAARDPLFIRSGCRPAGPGLRRDGDERG
jgi:hypothetical protein